MNRKELVELLNEFPEDMEVGFWNKTDDSFDRIDRVGVLDIKYERKEFYLRGTQYVETSQGTITSVKIICFLKDRFSDLMTKFPKEKVVEK